MSYKLLALEMAMMLTKYHYIDGRYCETRKFKRLFKVVLYEVLKHKTNKEAGPIIHQALKNIFLEPFTRVGVYKQMFCYVSVCFATCIMERSYSY